MRCITPQLNGASRTREDREEAPDELGDGREHGAEHARARRLSYDREFSRGPLNSDKLSWDV